MKKKDWKNALNKYLSSNSCAWTKTEEKIMEKISGHGAYKEKVMFFRAGYLARKRSIHADR